MKKHSEANSMDFKNKSQVAVINGAYGGIGSAIALNLAKKGYNLALIGRNENKLNKISNLILEQSKDCTIKYYCTDATNFEEMNNISKKIQVDFNQIDTIIHSVGAAPIGDIFSVSPESWKEGIDIGLMSQIYFVKSFSEILVKQNFGKIILINGILSIQPDPNFIISSTTTGAIRNFAKAISKEFGKHNISVNVVNPGPTETPLWEKVLSDLSKKLTITEEALSQNVKSGCPFGKIASPDEIAHVVSFLSSKETTFLNGISIAIDGGAVSALS